MTDRNGFDGVRNLGGLSPTIIFGPGARPNVVTLPPTPHMRIVQVSVAEVKATMTRREFRQLLGERLNDIYQELLIVWQREHPEASE